MPMIAFPAVVLYMWWPLSISHNAADPQQRNHDANPAEGGEVGATRPSAGDQESLDLVAWALEQNDLEGARELLTEIIAGLGRHDPGQERARLAYLVELERLAERLGSVRDELRLQRDIVALNEHVHSAEHPATLSAKQSLAITMAEIGDLGGAGALFEHVLEARLRTLPVEDPDVLNAKANLASAKVLLGDLEAALALEKEVLSVREQTLPDDHQDLLAARANLARTLSQMGDFVNAIPIQQAVVATCARTMGPDSPILLGVRQNLGVMMREAGDFAAALAIDEEVLEGWKRILPVDHPDLLRAKQNLAYTRKELDDVEGALVLDEEVLLSRMRTLPENDPQILDAKANLASTRFLMGDYEGASMLEEEVLRERVRLPENHPDRLSAMGNHATTRRALGDLEGAREMLEDILAMRMQFLAPDDVRLVGTKLNLARVRKELHDLAGAELLEEEAVAALEASLPPGHPDILGAKLNLTATRYTMGNLEGARELGEEVVAGWSRRLPPDHRDVLRAKANLALIKHESDDLIGAREIEDELVCAWERLLPETHPDLLAAKLNLALTLVRLGDLPRAQRLQAEVLAVHGNSLAPDHPGLLSTKLQLASTYGLMGNHAVARKLLASVLEGMQARARQLRSDSARAARESARFQLEQLARILSSSDFSDPEGSLVPAQFETLENLRLASVANPEIGMALRGHPGMRDMSARLDAVRVEINDLAYDHPEEQEALARWSQGITRLAVERDRLETKLRSQLEDSGVFLETIDSERLGQLLAPERAAVTYFRYRGEPAGPKNAGSNPGEDSMLAFLVRAGGRVARIDLGRAGEIEDLVSQWRSAVEGPGDARGVRSGVASRGSELEQLGRRLTARILEPVIAASPGVGHYHLVLDDVLHLVPIDALPMADGLVGDALTIRIETSLARLLQEPRKESVDRTITLAGGIDYDASADPQLSDVTASAPPIQGSFPLRKPIFRYLPGTAREVEGIGALFAEMFGTSAVALKGERATKASLRMAAPRSAYLHLATHGWFADEWVSARNHSRTDRLVAWNQTETVLTGFAPETLCGLALAGANRGRDALGHVPGILTAEELATLDLHNCDLAVLSACETNVGIHRAGQGIQSLQTALHAAGARTAVTSLWRVDDAATGRLFEVFYTKLWKEELGKAAALWQAKMALRMEGHPPRDWAGWVLTGDPD